MKNIIKSIITLTIILVSFTSCKKEEVRPDCGCSKIIAIETLYDDQLIPGAIRYGDTIWVYSKNYEYYIHTKDNCTDEFTFYHFTAYPNDSNYLNNKLKKGNEFCLSSIDSTMAVLDGYQHEVLVKTIHGVVVRNFYYNKYKLITP